MALTDPLDARLSARLDLLRALCALLVLVDHATQLRLIAPAWRAPGVAAHVARAVTGLGHSAVMAFFVLSGFLVGGALAARARRDGDVDLGRYALDRATRLYVVLLPALALGALLDALGARCFAGLAWYTGGSPIDDRGFALRLAGWPLAANLLFLQGIVAPPFGSNGPLWSLANEAWYYLLFPLLLMPWLPRRRWTTRLALGVVGVALLAGLAASAWYGSWREPYRYYFVTRVAAYFPLWLLGVAVRAAPRALAPPAWCGAIIAVGAIAARDRYEPARWFGPSTVYAWDVAQAFAVAALIWSWRRRADTRAPAWAPLAANAAASSFTLYAVHVPALMFVAGAIAWWTGASPHRIDPPRPWWIGVPAIALVIAFAVLVSLVTERRTDAVRRLLRAKLGRAPVSAAAPA